MYRTDARHELNNAAIDMLVTVGLMASVMNRYPEHVQENFENKMRELQRNIEEVTAEFVGFGEAFDDSIDSES